MNTASPWHGAPMKRQLKNAAPWIYTPLHDYYLYDWHDKNKGFRWHGFKHHRFALANAEKDFDLTEKEKNIIYSHMFPLTFWCLPRSREAWIVTLADKRVAFAETLKKYKRKKKAEEQNDERP